MLNEFILLSIAHIIAVASPGADFAVVLKNTLRTGKSAGMLTAIGVGCGISVHLIYTLLGIAIILQQSETLFTIIKAVGAFYLLWLAWQAFHSRAKQSTTEFEFQPVEIGSFQAFRQGFLTNVFNPKVTVFFLVLFTNIVSPTTPMLFQGLYGLWLVLYTILWFVLVAWIFSRKVVLNWYDTHGHYIDWGMGIFLTFIAVKLLF
ncbi:LysE family translocator [Aliikangiella coralliicola]|uniref:LysE family translocator n=1 Tax=Aliikangiella coralliicola TaxID=2592383 RepID=A0A545U7X5_9GAMM|nr:LysE family transporter [Aliikangiella coralliicola]TQV85561.1 LysE family translocator [Aliikangiella coralliicola]